MIKCLTIATLCNLVYGAGNTAESNVQFQAFGGSIPVPQSMEINVRVTRENILNITMQNKVWPNGKVLMISLSRPSRPKESLGSEIRIVGQYSLNGFEVQLYQLDQANWSSDIVAAEIGRCGEWGQIIAKRKEDIDEYLLTIDAVESCPDDKTNASKEDGADF